MSRNNRTIQLCAHCGKPVRQDSNFLRAHLWGQAVLYHWTCFTKLMKEAEAEERKSA